MEQDVKSWEENFLREQRNLDRARRPKKGVSARVKITVESSTTVDTTTLPDQQTTVISSSSHENKSDDQDTTTVSDKKLTATLLSRHDNHPDDQGSVSSDLGHGVEESKEEAPEEEFKIGIKSSKSTSSSQYGSYTN